MELKRPKLSPRIDAVFRRIFGDEQDTRPLLGLLNAILDWEDPIVGVEILQPELTGELADSKASVLDLRARDRRGRLYNVELQLAARKEYFERALFYWARLYAYQLSEGQPYESLCPAVGIHFLDWQIPAHRRARKMSSQAPGYWSVYQLREEKTGHLLTGHLEIHTIEMPALRKPVEELSDPRERWIYFVRHGERLTEDQATQWGGDIQHANRKLMAVSQEEKMWHLKESLEKAERDRISLIHEMTREAHRQAQEADRQREEADRQRDEADRQRELQGVEMLTLLIGQRLGRDLTVDERAALEAAVVNVSAVDLTRRVLTSSLEQISGWLESLG